MTFDLSKPGVAVTPSSFGGGWAWALNDEGAQALYGFYQEQPADTPLGHTAYIVEPHDTHDIAVYLREAGVAWVIQ